MCPLMPNTGMNTASTPNHASSCSTRRSSSISAAASRGTDTSGNRLMSIELTATATTSGRGPGVSMRSSRYGRNVRARRVDRVQRRQTRCRPVLDRHARCTPSQRIRCQRHDHVAPFARLHPAEKYGISDDDDVSSRRVDGGGHGAMAHRMRGDRDVVRSCRGVGRVGSRRAERGHEDRHAHGRSRGPLPSVPHPAPLAQA